MHTECVVTKTDQAVTISKSSSTSTITSISHAVFEKWPGGYGMHNHTKKMHEVLMKTWVASFLNIGPLAMPGYGGSGLCAGCGPDNGGSRSQTFNVTECWTGPFRNSSCSEYMEIWISRHVPSRTSSVSAVVSTTLYVASQGTYTFAFTQQAPAITVLAPARTVTVTLLDGETSQLMEAARTITVPGTPWSAVVTSTCQGPTFFDVVTTVTTTATWIAPYETGTSTSGQHGGWHFPIPLSSTVTTRNPESTSADAQTSYTQSTSTRPSTIGPVTSNVIPHSASSGYSSNATSVSTTTTQYGTSSSSTGASSHPSTTSALSTDSSSTTDVSSRSSTASTFSTGISTTAISSLLSRTSTFSSDSTTYSSSTTTTSTTVTSSSAPVPTDSFYIRIGAAASIAKRASRYLAFVNGYGVVVDSQKTAGLFALDAKGLLQAGGDFVGAEVDVSRRILQSSTSATLTSKTWALSGNGALSLEGTSGFCELESGQIAITIAGSSIQDCVLVSLVHQARAPISTPSSTTHGTSSTTSSSIHSSIPTSTITTRSRTIHSTSSTKSTSVFSSTSTITASTTLSHVATVSTSLLRTTITSSSNSTYSHPSSSNSLTSTLKPSTTTDGSTSTRGTSAYSNTITSTGSKTPSNNTTTSISQPISSSSWGSLDSTSRSSTTSNRTTLLTTTKATSKTSKTTSTTSTTTVFPECTIVQGSTFEFEVFSSVAVWDHTYAEYDGNISSGIIITTDESRAARFTYAQDSTLIAPDERIATIYGAGNRISFLDQGAIDFSNEYGGELTTLKCVFERGCVLSCVAGNASVLQLCQGIPALFNELQEDCDTGSLRAFTPMSPSITTSTASSRSRAITSISTSTVSPQNTTSTTAPITSANTTSTSTQTHTPTSTASTTTTSSGPACTVVSNPGSDSMFVLRANTDVADYDGKYVIGANGVLKLNATSSTATQFMLDSDLHLVDLAGDSAALYADSPGYVELVYQAWIVSQDLQNLTCTFSSSCEMSCMTDPGINQLLECYGTVYLSDGTPLGGCASISLRAEQVPQVFTSSISSYTSTTLSTTTNTRKSSSISSPTSTWLTSSSFFNSSTTVRQSTEPVSFTTTSLTSTTTTTTTFSTPSGTCTWAPSQSFILMTPDFADTLIVANSEDALGTLTANTDDYTGFVIPATSDKQLTIFTGEGGEGDSGSIANIVSSTESGAVDVYFSQESIITADARDILSCSLVGSDCQISCNGGSLSVLMSCGGTLRIGSSINSGCAEVTLLASDYGG
ncbi:hypothetical protein, variant [Exophiala sideris]|nr:hypothetical protein, variant [Exophiala sideris]